MLTLCSLSCCHNILSCKFYNLISGIARLSDVYVPFPYIAPIFCALLCEKEKEMDNFMCLLEFECAKRLRAHSQAIPVIFYPCLCCVFHYSCCLDQKLSLNILLIPLPWQQDLLGYSSEKGSHLKHNAKKVLSALMFLCVTNAPGSFVTNITWYTESLKAFE